MPSAFFLLTIVAVISAQTIVDVPLGSNYTLIGPTIHSEVTWCRLNTEDYYNVFCDGDDDIQVTCNKQNLTLINVTKSYNGYYYGYDRSGSEFKNYLVRTIPPITNIKIEKLQMDSDILSNLTISPTTPSEQNIPSSMIAIIAAVAVGMAIIITCMIVYACCYKKIRREKQDSLLNYDF